ncbi:flagellar hook assembly protein FlgD [Altererythrobacter lutimaris]|uniref:Basal-body rod modification protein FlgD n=1 Tax=Altererythrobacter lutimaris TaxID=2743979 RepID=A0A850HFM4_9SPHN|nr:flagellar hook capping FlgD N-terminal domain-containing protein [Altererythrobacter lutimaris]NVE93302.1 flagellar hook capping protein [Altererythrobacter lutimaris]
MTDTTTVSNANASRSIDALNAPGATPLRNGFSDLGQADFLRLLTVQLQQQDPFEPMDNKDMLAQMAEFSALAGSDTTNDKLSEISKKLDALIQVQMAAQQASMAAANAITQINSGVAAESSDPVTTI